MVPEAKAKTTHLLASMWERNRPLMLERLELLDRTAEAIRTTSLSPELHEEATRTAHNLAGSLGMFGIPAGTEFARSLELELDRSAPDADQVLTLARSLRASMFPKE